MPGAGSSVPLPGVGGKRRSAYVTPSSIPPSVSRSAPHGGSGNPLPAPFGSLVCDAKWKVSFPGGVPRGTTWATTLSGSWCCQQRGRGGSPSQAGTPGIPITREPCTPGCGAARGGDACWLRCGAMAALGSRVEAAPPAPTPQVLSRSALGTVQGNWASLGSGTQGPVCVPELRVLKAARPPGVCLDVVSAAFVGWFFLHGAAAASRPWKAGGWRRGMGTGVLLPLPEP